MADAELIINIEAQTGGLDRALLKTERQVNRFSTRIGRMLTRLGSTSRRASKRGGASGGMPSFDMGKPGKGGKMSKGRGRRGGKMTLSQAQNIAGTVGNIAMTLAGFTPWGRGLMIAAKGARLAQGALAVGRARGAGSRVLGGIGTAVRVAIVRLFSGIKRIILNVAFAARAAAKTIFKAMTVIGSVIAAVAIKAARDLLKTQDAFAQLGAKLGLAGEEMADVERITKDIFRTNTGLKLSLEEVGGAAVQVKRALGGSEQELQAWTRDLLRFDQITGGAYGVERIVGAVANIGRVWGGEPTNILNRLYTSSTKVNDSQGELIDTFIEYSAAIAEAGFTFEDFLGRIERGVTVGGIMGFDKGADLLLSFIDVTDEIDQKKIDALSQLGPAKWVQSIVQAMRGQSFDLTRAEAFDLMVDRLLELDDLGLQRTIGESLFGALFKDLGVQGVAALRGLDEPMQGLKDMNRTLEEMGQILDNVLASKWARVMNTLGLNLQAAVAPFLPEILDSLNRISIALIGADLEKLITVVLPGLVRTLAAVTAVLLRFVAILSEIITTIPQGILSLAGGAYRELADFAGLLAGRRQPQLYWNPRPGTNAITGETYPPIPIEDPVARSHGLFGLFRRYERVTPGLPPKEPGGGGLFRTRETVTPGLPPKEPGGGGLFGTPRIRVSPATSGTGGFGGTGGGGNIIINSYNTDGSQIPRQIDDVLRERRGLR